MSGTSSPTHPVARPRALGHWMALLAVAIAVRVGHWALNPIVQRDGVTFLGLARAASEDGPSVLLQDNQHPLFPAAIWGLARIVGDREASGLWLNLLAGALTVMPAVLLGRRLLRSRAGFIAGWLFALGRYPVDYSATVLSDGLHGLFFTTALWAGAAAVGFQALRCDESERARSPGRAGWFLLCGASSGLAYLTRPEGIAAGASIGLLAALCFLRGRCAHSAAWARGIVVLATGLALTAGPYVAHLSREAGTLTITRKKPVGQSLRAGLDLPVRAAWAAQPGEQEESATTPAKERTRFRGLLKFAGSLGEAMGIGAALFAVGGAFARRMRRASCEPALFALVPTAAFAAVLSGVFVAEGYVGRRHTSPLVPLLLPWAGAGLCAAGAGLERLRRGRFSAKKATVLLTTILALATTWKSLDFFKERGPEWDEKQLGLELRRVVSSKDSVLPSSGAQRAAYYSGAHVVLNSDFIGGGKLEEAATYARKERVEWLLVASPAAVARALPAGLKLEHRMQSREFELLLLRVATN